MGVVDHLFFTGLDQTQPPTADLTRINEQGGAHL